jgi:hypothetical protein
VWSGNLAPDDSDLSAPDLLLCLVDVCDLLAEVEAIEVVSRRSLVYVGRSRTLRHWCHQLPQS